MSVHGEFERYLDETLTALRELESPGEPEWASALRARATNTKLSLEVRARAVLDSPLADEDAWSEHPRLQDAAQGLLAISRIVLGC